MRTTEVNIAQQDLVARQTTLQIDPTKREAELAQARDIANKTAGHARRGGEGRADGGSERSRIPDPAGTGGRQQADREQTRRARHVGSKPISRSSAATTEMERDLQIVAQESAIVVAAKSKEQSEAQTIAETARALAIAAEEKVTTARSAEIAERDRLINVIAARKAAETEAMPITIMADAEKEAAANKAQAISVLAKAEADAAITAPAASGRSVRPRPKSRRSRRRRATS